MTTDITCSTSPVCVFAGQHALAELSGIRAPLLDDVDFLTESLHTALVRAGATVLDVVSRRFQPQGVTVLALLSESHASIHTYPEHGALFVDVFTCGTRARPSVAIEHLAHVLEARAVRHDVIRRGQPDVGDLPAAVIA